MAAGLFKAEPGLLMCAINGPCDDEQMEPVVSQLSGHVELGEKAATAESGDLNLSTPLSYNQQRERERVRERERKGEDRKK